jgi:hypothetical protein
MPDADHGYLVEPVPTDAAVERPRTTPPPPSRADPAAKREEPVMPMGYEIRIIEKPSAGMCPLCGCDAPIRPGLIIVQRPSGDVVCEDCAETELAVLFQDIRVLRADTPTDFPDAYRALAARPSTCWPGCRG